MNDQREERGLGHSTVLQVPAEFMNPYAVGHLINHPPPDVCANVKTVDLDLPYTFFPSYMTRYLPFVNSFDVEYSRHEKTETRSNKTLRAVALVAQQTIAHGEELYLDYIMDRRTEIDYTPDWLIEPPSPSPYLQKKDMVTELPFTVKLLLSYEQAK